MECLLNTFLAKVLVTDMAALYLLERVITDEHSRSGGTVGSVAGVTRVCLTNVTYEMISLHVNNQNVLRTEGKDQIPGLLSSAVIGTDKVVK